MYSSDSPPIALPPLGARYAGGIERGEERVEIEGHPAPRHVELAPIAELHADCRLKGAQVREIVGCELSGAPPVEVFGAPVVARSVLIVLRREQDGVSIAHHDRAS